MDGFDRNRDVYRGGKWVAEYADLDNLQAPERAILADFADEVADAALLDIGIGGGRTTAHLATVVDRYVGVDYSPEMVTAAKERFPLLDLREADARTLTDFADDEFDVTVFSFNGLDYVGHEDRLQALAQMARVTRPGGLVILSTHNREASGFDKLPWQGSRRPNRFWLEAAIYYPRHRLKNRQAIHEDEYAVINDRAHSYSLLTYYLSREHAERQLDEAGLTPIAAYGLDGQRLGKGDRASGSAWIYYVARKREVAPASE